MTDLDVRPARRALRRGPVVFFGVLAGAFLIGRPFPLFRTLFRDAAESHDPLYGAAAFVVQSVGNVLVVAVVLLLVTWLAGRRLQAWFAADPRRIRAQRGVPARRRRVHLHVLGHPTARDARHHPVVPAGALGVTENDWRTTCWVRCADWC